MTDLERAAHCASCRAAIPPSEQLYTLRIDLFASAKPPEFDDGDLLADHREEWERLLLRMADMTPRETEEEGAKVFERCEFTVCARCRAIFHEHIRVLQR